MQLFLNHQGKYSTSHTESSLETQWCADLRTTGKLPRNLNNKYKHQSFLPTRKRIILSTPSFFETRCERGQDTHSTAAYQVISKNKFDFSERCFRTNFKFRAAEGSSNLPYQEVCAWNSKQICADCWEYQNDCSLQSIVITMRAYLHGQKTLSKR